MSPGQSLQRDAGGRDRSVSDDVRRVTTREEHDRFNAARSRGGLCAACGRALDPGETVYVEQMMIDLTALASPRVQWFRGGVRRDAPLGIECASRKFVARTAGRTPERCKRCDRPVYYAKERAGRQQAACSEHCRSHGR
jgi:hypothetical protein